jgi:UDP-N-acetylmuramate--alanine ligase
MKRIHLIGIGGSGLSAIARLLKEDGYMVSGSDLVASPITDELRSLGIQVSIGHAAENVKGADMVLRSSAIPNSNPEIQAARQARIPVLKRAEFLDELTGKKTLLAVGGTHGKTTTTAMIAWVLTSAGKDPSYIIGGISKNLRNNAHAGKGPYFVIEADEYDNMFLGLHPDLAVITNIEHDHPDFFPTPEDYLNAFDGFVQQIKPAGTLIVSADNLKAASFLEHHPQGIHVLSYGIEHEADYHAANLTLLNGCFTFDIMHREGDRYEKLVQVQLIVPGVHNVRNATAAVSVAHQLGFFVDEAARTLSEYQGTERRFDVLGEINGITLIDDYAHHPTEIKTTLSAARLQFQHKKLWVVWQPHTFSRIKTFIGEYADAFHDADHLIIMEVYAARERDSEFSARQLTKIVDNPNTLFLPTNEDVIQHLSQTLSSGDIVLVLSAGDALGINQNLLHILDSERNTQSMTEN